MGCEHNLRALTLPTQSLPIPILDNFPLVYTGTEENSKPNAQKNGGSMGERTFNYGKSPKRDSKKKTDPDEKQSKKRFLRDIKVNHKRRGSSGQKKYIMIALEKIQHEGTRTKWSPKNIFKGLHSQPRAMYLTTNHLILLTLHDDKHETSNIHLKLMYAPQPNPSLPTKLFQQAEFWGCSRKFFFNKGNQNVWGAQASFFFNKGI